MKFLNYRAFLFILFFSVKSFAQTPATITLETLNGSHDRTIAFDSTNSGKILLMDEEKTSGKKVFVWQESDATGSSNKDIYCAVYDKDMNVLNARFKVNTNNPSPSTDQSYAAVLVNQTDNSFIVVWASNHITANGYDVYAKRIRFANFSTDILTADILVSDGVGNTGQFAPVIAFDYAYNDILIAWRDPDTGGGTKGYDSYLRRVSWPSLVPNTASFVINAVPDNHQLIGAMGVNPLTGEIYTVFYSLGYTNNYDIVFGKFNRSSTNPNTISRVLVNGQNEVVINSYTTGIQDSPTLVINETTGDYAITWKDDVNQQAGKAAFSCIFNKFNNVVKADFRVSTISADNRLFSKPIWDEYTGSLVYFYHMSSSATQSVRYQAYDEDYNLSGSETIASIAPTNNYYYYSFNVRYNQENKKIFLCYDTYPYVGSTNTAGHFRQFSYTAPAPIPPAAVTNQNYIESQEIYKPLTDPATTNTLNADETKITRTFFDGLGRKIQTVIVKGSPNKKDMVSPEIYDPRGREVKSYLPYAASTSDGSFKSNALNSTYSSSDQYAFYNNSSVSNADKIINDVYPYSEILYESTTADVVTEQSAPGNSWRMGSGHTVFASKTVNLATDNIRVWTVSGSTAGSTTTYAANLLFKESAKDEMGITTESYSDKLGKLICKKVIASGCTTSSCTLVTCYIYDDFGNVIYIVTPEAINQMQSSGTYSLTYNGTSHTDQMIYGYKYDSWQRPIEKKIPGKAIVYFAYNNASQVVVTQDGNLRTTSKWAYTKYDALGRTVMTGLHVDGSSLATIQAAINNAGSYTQFEKRNGTVTTSGYTNTSYPTTTDTDILTINYYDDYTADFDNNSATTQVYTAAGFSPEPIPEPARNFGRLICTKAKNLDNSAWLIKIYFFDKYGNQIQTQSNNHKNSSIVSSVTSQYDFVGKVLRTKEITNTTLHTITINKRYQYDSKGRLKNTYQQNNTDAEVMLSQNRYNELGQVIEKNLHSESMGTKFLQSLDYTYNIRGWMTHLNNSALINTTIGASPSDDNNNDANDYFGMQLAYDNAVTGASATPMYNGNVSLFKWKTATAMFAGNERAYSYSYDGLYRMSQALYGQSITGPISFYNNYSETGITYDNNGNITALKRYDASANVIDNLSYSYTNKGNQLNKVNEVGTGTSAGFNDRGSTSDGEYAYDGNGNLSKDANKKIMVINYNYLNQPVRVQFDDNGAYQNKVEYIYDATGVMLQKKVTANGVLTTSDYVGGLYYIANTLQYFKTSEGRAGYNGTSYDYQYNIKDHLGNLRMIFDKTGIVQEDNYYPFGMAISTQIYRIANNAGTDNFRFASKEYQDGLDNTGDHINDFDWDVMDFGARMYDGCIGKWISVDPATEKYHSFSPYNYVKNNPATISDPDGADDSWEYLAYAAIETQTIVDQMLLNQDAAFLINKARYALYQASQEALNAQMEETRDYMSKLSNSITTNAEDVNIGVKNMVATEANEATEGNQGLAGDPLRFHSSTMWVTDGHWKTNDGDFGFWGGQHVQVRLQNNSILPQVVTLRSPNKYDMPMTISMNPGSEFRYDFYKFANVPINWEFELKAPTVYDAVNMKISIYSNWIPGDPIDPNNPFRNSLPIK